MRKLRSYNMPEWARQRLEAIAKAYEITMTEALLRCLDQGSKWHRKNIQKQINPAFDWEPKQPGVILQYVDELNEETQRNIEIAKTRWVDD